LAVAFVGATDTVGDGNCVGALHATRNANATKTSVWVMNDLIVSSIEISVGSVF
jgi:hypothetical protein